jgi:hypothetical protein
MKKNIIFIAIYIIGITSVFAQTESDSVKTKNTFFHFNMKEKISYEIRAGFNFSTLSPKIPENLQAELGENQITRGGNIGILANLPFLENIYFHTGLLFTTKSYHLFCIEYPLLVSYRANIANNLKWSMNAGVYWGKLFVFGDNNSEIRTSDELELGLLLGTGLYYKKCYVGIQADLGLNNVYHASTVNDKFFAKSRVFSIMLGYQF